MKTVTQKATKESIAAAASLLKKGYVVAMPTETVYGLGANALNPDAVQKIFDAKHRPSDNPLIVHVANEEMLALVAARVSPKARALIKKFWPGPLTIIFPAKKAVPLKVTGGLSTVAVRMPSHQVALTLIKAAGVPIAAPSANRSGRPSPTTAAHVFADLHGRIPLILDGGQSAVGVESTVIDVSRTPAVVLRPGAVTLEQLAKVIGPVQLAGEKSKVRSPGMKYTHYSPKAKVVLVMGPTAAVAKDYPGAKVYKRGELTIKNVYASLRKADEDGYSVLVIPAVPEKGAGVALMNRLRKAASVVVDS